MILSYKQMIILKRYKGLLFISNEKTNRYENANVIKFTVRRVLITFYGMTNYEV